MKKNDRIYVAGHKGLVGSAVLRKLKLLNYSNIITAEKKNLDLLDQKKVFTFLKKNKIKSLIICAARVGGIKANNVYKANFIYENLTIQNNLIHGAKINNRLQATDYMDAHVNENTLIDPSKIDVSRPDSINALKNARSQINYNMSARDKAFYDMKQKDEECFISKYR